MKRYICLAWLVGISAQVRVGDMLSVTSSFNVRNMTSHGQTMFMATGGGLLEYSLKMDEYKLITKDHGLEDTDLTTVHIGPKGMVWIGSNMGVQIWDPTTQSLREFFQLDISEVSGLSTYKEMVYAAVKNNGQWGIMEFIHANNRTFYRDFYGRSDIQSINEIVTFNDQLLLHTDLGLIGGNPHLQHPIFWSKVFPGLNENISTIDVNNDVLAIVTKKAIYVVQGGENPELLIRENKNIGTITNISVIDSARFNAISDSVIFDVGPDRLNVEKKDIDMGFTDILFDQKNMWFGSRIGFSYKIGIEFGSSLNHIVENGPLVASPTAIKFIGNDRWIMGSKNGLSLSGWSNWSSSSTSLSLNDKLDIEKSPIHLGVGVSKILNQNNKIFISVNQSKSAGVFSIDISNGITLDKLFLPKPILMETSNLYSSKDISFDKKGNIWVVSDNSFNEPLSVFNEEENRHFSISNSNGYLTNQINKITVDNFNRIWVGSPNGLVMYKYTGDVMDPSEENWTMESVNPGLPKREPLAIDVSEKNQLWILTPIGLIYKNLQISENNPVIETGPLVNNEIYPYFPNGAFNYSSKIRFDPRGNIWVTSQTDGIFIVKDNGEYWPDINGLNTSNSNLLSNHVNDVSFDGQEGLAYVATNKGVSVVRIPYADKKKSYSTVEIFPSPYRIPNARPMTIEGLKDNSSLTIMTLNGKVIKKIPNSSVKGYQAFWDGLDDEGRLVGSGVYLLAIYDQNGSSFIEKIAVIRE